MNTEHGLRKWREALEREQAREQAREQERHSRAMTFSHWSHASKFPKEESIPKTFPSAQYVERARECE